MQARSSLSRRHLLGAAAVAGAAALAASAPRRARTQGRDDRRFLIVFGASGGASLLDSVLAVRASECPTPDTLNVFPDDAVQSIEGSPFRAVRWRATSVGAIPYGFEADQRPFVAKHGANLLAVTCTTSSVNHAVGQRRAVTGNEAFRGRTLQELVALTHGQGALLPNVHLSTGTGFNEAGTDATLPAACYGEVVANPVLWPLALHGSRGTPGAGRADAIDAARRVRDERLDELSPFARLFRDSPTLRAWRELRGERLRRFEQGDWISRLTLLPDTADTPLAPFGLASAPEAEQVRAAFPGYATDPLDAQAALAFLLLKNRLSAAVTLGTSFEFGYDASAAPGGAEGDDLPPGSVFNLPIGFDFSHDAHRATQAFMWQRTLRVIDRLIDLLRGVAYGDGGSLWDRTLIYVATDFGRTKSRPAGALEFGSGHDLNNGALVLSPLVRGGRVLGGVDPATALTYGFDLRTGAPDPNRHTSEAELFAGLLGALGVDLAGSGLPDVPALRGTG
jgi:hypothetical protein